MKNTQHIDSLLKAPPSATSANDLIEWAQNTRDSLQRGDMVLGILTPEVVAKIPQAYETAAIHGEPSAWLALAWWHAVPDYGQSDLKAAEAAARKGIEAGAPEAEMELVKLIWFFKRETATDKEKVALFELLSSVRQAEPKNGDVLYYMGLFACAGFGTEESPAKAVEYLQESVKVGNADAMFELSLYYAMGIGVSKNESKSFQLCKAAADVGHPRATYNIGAFYAVGEFVEKNIPEAIKWYEESAASGNPSAMIGLAAIYATGDGVEPDLEYAEQLLDQAEYLGLDVSKIRSKLGL